MRIPVDAMRCFPPGCFTHAGLVEAGCGIAATPEFPKAGGQVARAGFVETEAAPESEPGA